MHKNKYRSKCWLPYAVIEDAVKNNWLPSLAILVLLKRVHENNTFYNFAYSKTAKQLKVSQSALRKHVQILLEKGLARRSGKNLTITAVRKVAKNYKTFLVPVTTEAKFVKSLATIKLAIKATLVIRNIHKQQFTIHQRSEVIKYRDSEFIKKQDIPVYRKLMKKFDFTPEKRFDKNVVLSLNGFGKSICRSQATGKRLKKELIKLGLIESKKNTELYSTRKMTRRQFFMLELPVGYFISRSGYIYKNNPCIISARLGKRYM